MVLLKAFTLFFLASLGFGSAFIPSLQDRRAILKERDVTCAPQNMIVDVSRYDCNKKFTLDSHGHCSSAIPAMPGNEGCMAYCEIRLTMSYGQEVPFSDGYCPQNTQCTVSSSVSVTVTNTYTISAGVTLKKRDTTVDPVELEAAFNLGATYSYSKSVTYTVTTGLVQQPVVNQCGSCGTLTNAGTDATGIDLLTHECNHEYTDSVNYCNVTPFKDANGHADGKSIFVKVDCKTNEILPLSQQDEVYQYPGVSTAQNRQLKVNSS